MTKKQFIRAANRLAMNFASLVTEFNAENGHNSAEVFGNVSHTGKGTILVASISFSMQQDGSISLKEKLEPATLDFSIGSYTSTKMITGKYYFDDNGCCVGPQVTEYKYGEEV